MRYIEGYDREQQLLLPESIEDYVTIDNPVRFIDAYVDGLDLAKLGFRYAVTEETGRKPYDPADLLKLYIYGYLNKTRSSRQLEKATYRNLELIWLLRKLHPDHKTIADFRKDNTKALKGVCREFTLLCHKLKLFGGELIAIDSSKFGAVNHSSQSLTKKRLQALLKEINDKISAYLSGLDQQDQVETKIPGVTAGSLHDKITQLETHKAEVEKLQAELEASGETQISLTDPDSRLMQTAAFGTDVCYSVQIVTDDKHKLIVTHEVTNDHNDRNQLSHMATQAKEVLQVETMEATADASYFKKEEIKQCQDQNITCYVPIPEVSSNKKRGLFTEQEFQYDAAQDCYHCPAQQVLTYRGPADEDGRDARVYEGVACKTCALRSRCTESKRNNRRIYRWIHATVLEELRQRLAQHPDKVKKRGQLVEHPFGTLKHAMNHSYFLMRGFEKVSAEMSLSVLVYNLKRVLNILGVKELIQALA
jgi:transposase